MTTEPPEDWSGSLEEWEDYIDLEFSNYGRSEDATLITSIVLLMILAAIVGGCLWITLS